MFFRNESAILNYGIADFLHKNTCSNLIIYSGNEIKTSKKDEPEMHGIGIKNIIQIVEKYNGEYVIKNENNEFSFSIIIPL